MTKDSLTRPVLPTKSRSLMLSRHLPRKQNRVITLGQPKINQLHDTEHAMMGNGTSLSLRTSVFLF